MENIEDIINKFIDSGDSLNSFCIENELPYMKIYKAIKKQHPNLISIKNNGKTEKSKISQRNRIKVKASKKELEELFFDKGMGQKEIAEYYGVSKPLISKIMKGYSIDVKSAGQSRYWDEERRERFRILANSGVIGVFKNSNWKYHSTSIEKYFICECEKLGIEYKRQYSIEKYGHQYDFTFKIIIS